MFNISLSRSYSPYLTLSYELKYRIFENCDVWKLFNACLKHLYLDLKKINIFK